MSRVASILLLPLKSGQPAILWLWLKVCLGRSSTNKTQYLPFFCLLSLSEDKRTQQYQRHWVKEQNKTGNPSFQQLKSDKLATDELKAENKGWLILLTEQVKKCHLWHPCPSVNVLLSLLPSPGPTGRGVNGAGGTCPAPLDFSQSDPSRSDKSIPVPGCHLLHLMQLQRYFRWEERIKLLEKF